MDMVQLWLHRSYEYDACSADQRACEFGDQNIQVTLRIR